MSYTRIFEKPYEDGYKDKPFETTPVTASTLNDKDDALEHIEDYLETAIVANPVLEGTEDSLTSIGIEGTNYKIEGGGGGGGIESDIIASNYDAETTYNAGQYCFYNDTIWRCKVTSAGETPEEGDFWTEVVVMDEVETAMNSGGDANIWYGTHAEYEEEKTTIEDGTQVCFTDDVGLEAGSEYYSETEQIVGTYMGKPLYRKSVFFTPAYVAGTGQRVVLGISDIDAIFLDSEHTFLQYSNVYRILPYGSSIANTSIDGWLDKSGNFEIRYGTAYSSIAFNSGCVTVEYTKTTDSVVGVINGIRNGDNYSTTERVIGTWIDGKPLYRRTWNKNEILNFTAGQWTDTGISASGIDRYINAGIVNMASASASKWTVDIGTQNGNMVLNYFRTAQLTNWALTVEYTKTTD